MHCWQHIAQESSNRPRFVPVARCLQGWIVYFRPLFIPEDRTLPWRDGFRQSNDFGIPASFPETGHAPGTQRCSGSTLTMVRWWRPPAPMVATWCCAGPPGAWWILANSWRLPGRTPRFQCVSRIPAGDTEMIQITPTTKVLVAVEPFNSSMMGRAGAGGRPTRHRGPSAFHRACRLLHER